MLRFAYSPFEEMPRNYLFIYSFITLFSIQQQLFAPRRQNEEMQVTGNDVFLISAQHTLLPQPFPAGFKHLHSTELCLQVVPVIPKGT